MEAASVNWIQSGGCEILKAIQTKVTHEDIFIKPELDEIVNEEHALLLQAPTVHEICEFQLRVAQPFKIESVALVCSVPKIELFVGAQKEYMETVYGTSISESESDDEPPYYRYDLEIEKSGIVELTLKLLTHESEICIYGTLLHIAPNPNGVTTLLAPAAINLDNVQQMLKNCNQKLSVNAEKCKMFMEIYKKATSLPSTSTAQMSQQNANVCGATNSALLQQMQQLSAAKPNCGSAVTALPENVTNTLQTHIDMRLQEMEKKINERLDAIEVKQMEKLDAILKMLVEAKQSKIE